MRRLVYGIVIGIGIGWIAGGTFQKRRDTHLPDYDALAAKHGGTAVAEQPASPVALDMSTAEPLVQVPMFDPNGTLRDVPAERVAEALAHGGHLAVWSKDRKGKWCFTPTIPQGYKLDDCGAVAR